MARIRTIKPEFFTSEDIVNLTPLARLFYVSLWCESDREGRLEWKPRTFKLRYFPGDNCDIDLLATELTDSGLVILYEVNGILYAEIPTFKEHQVINNREGESIIPSKTLTRESGVETRESGREGRKEGKEGNGKEGDTSATDVAGIVYPQSFLSFWNMYPKKKSKGDAFKAFKKLNAAEYPAIKTGLEAAKKSADWQKNNGEFIPYPASWLNDRGWEDESGDAPKIHQKPLCGICNKPANTQMSYGHRCAEHIGVEHAKSRT